MLLKLILLALAAAGAALGVDGAEPGPEAGAPQATPARTVVWALGDGADGSAEGRELARYVSSRKPERFLYLGDVYEHGAPDEFQRHYDPLYGGLAHRTDPVIGNHEYDHRVEGYYPYWQRARGFGRVRARHRSYVDDTGWQVLVYSSESDPETEAAWLSRRIARHPGTCRIAAGHRGRYVVADDSHDDNADQEPVWAALAGRTAVNLVGHNHLYGRLAPIDGVHVLLSGAGGHDLRELGEQRHVTAAAETGVPTATRLVLRRGALDFTQVDAQGRVYDSGTIPCAPAG